MKKFLGDVKDKYDEYSDKKKRDRKVKEKIERDRIEKKQPFVNSVNSLLDKFEIPVLNSSVYNQAHNIINGTFTENYYD